MNVIEKLCMVTAIYGLAACKTENQLDLCSLNIDPYNQEVAISGLIVTKQHSPLSVPEEYSHIHTLSSHLLEHHWLQHDNFLGDLADLKAKFKKTSLPEAASFIIALDKSKERYLSYLNNVDAIAVGMQRQIDKDLKNYRHSIYELSNKIHFLETSEITYQERVSSLEAKVKSQSSRYNQLSAAFRQALQRTINKHDSSIKLIDELSFSFDNRPHGICRQYHGMSDLLTTVTTNCVYINRDQLLAPFPDSLKNKASKVIDSYAADIWHAMTELNGYFDTANNTQHFPDNLNYQLAQARRALREKTYINERESALLLHRYQQELVHIKQQRDEVLNLAYLDENLRIDTQSGAFIRKLNLSVSPLEPFSNLYQSADIKQRFTHAYAEKIISQYPYELSFTVSSSGYFSIPNKSDATGVIFYFNDIKQFLSYDLTKHGQRPEIINKNSAGLSLNTQSLIDVLSGKLKQRWAI
ncbi:hypothetical protein ACQKP8_22110 [Photobacterium alginatilyticum]|uniref:hypothetical protein n=1 Tax=Photobacterium alginatilyticum TaxID=1775171 RepID=UPI00406816E8